MNTPRTAAWRWVWLLPSLAGVVACPGDPGLIRVEGSGFFDPPVMEYGTRAVGDTHQLMTRLRNASPGRILVQDIRFEPPQEVYAAFITDGGTLRGATLAPNEVVDITLVYRPLLEGDFDATMLVVAEDLEIPLEIVARAREVAPARPGLSPSQIRFFGSEVGRDVHQTVRVENVGDTDGVLSAVGARAPFSVRAVGGAELSLPSLRLSPGEHIDVEVHYVPTAAGPAEDRVAFRFDTDEAAELQVTGDAVEPGVMTCTPAVVDLGDLPRGQAASAPVTCVVEGGPYSLDVIRLADGSAAFFSLDPATPTLTEGRLSFEVRLDGLGLAGRHDAVVEIIPKHRVVTRVAATANILPPPEGESDLEVEMVWNTGNSDFDLHLVRLDGTPFEAGRDCYFEDKHPDWGQVGYIGDDPVLTTDDVNGFGPEQVSLLYAAEPYYDLFVQFYGFESQIPPSTSVRVTYQLRGQAEQTVSRDLLECGVLWRVGRFYFDGDNRRFVPDGALSMDFVPRASASCQP